jgi:hypothetical protein
VSNLKKRLMKKAETNFSDFKIVGFNTVKDEVITYTASTNDDTIKNKFYNNKLSALERGMVADKICEYFCSEIKTNPTLYHYGVEEIIILFENNVIDINSANLDVDYIYDNCYQNKQKSKLKEGEDPRVFSEQKYRVMDLAKKQGVLSNPAEFFWDVWGSDFENVNFDIRYLVDIEGMKYFEEFPQKTEKPQSTDEDVDNIIDNIENI